MSMLNYITPRKETLTKFNIFPKHPYQLPFMFMMEMWERFSYYLMLALLYLYMSASALKGGLGFSPSLAATIAGTYGAFVYFTPFLGGLLADSKLGYRRSILIGACIMMLGHFLLAFSPLTFFYAGLACLIIGNGFFKPNMSTLLGRLYSRDDPEKQNGYNIFYFGINLGAFLCAFVAAMVRNSLGWHWAFGTAGIGLAIGIIFFFLPIYRHLEEADIQQSERDASRDKAFEQPSFIMSRVIPLAFFLGALVFALTFYCFNFENDNQRIKMAIDLGFFALVLPIFGYYFLLYRRSDVQEKDQFLSVFSIIILAIPFWMIFNFNTTLFNEWAEKYTNREAPPSTETVLDAVGLLQPAPVEYFVNAAPETPRPAIAWLTVISDETKLGELQQSYAKTLEDSGYETAGPVPVSKKQFDETYAKAGPGYDKLMPGQSLKLFNSELFQSINPLAIMFLTPLIIMFWAFLRKRNLEPTTSFKFAWAQIFPMLSMLVMALAAYLNADGELKSSLWWLISAYLVITVGELCISPIGLNTISQLSPPRLTAVMMGGWLMSSAIGNKLSGLSASLTEGRSQIASYLLLAAVSAVAAIFTFAVAPWLRRKMKE